MLKNEDFFRRINETFQLKTAKDYNRIVSQYVGMLTTVQAKLRSEGLRAAKKTFELQQSEWKRWVKENVDTTKTNLSPIEDFGKVKWGRSVEDSSANLESALKKLNGMMK